MGIGAAGMVDLDGMIHYAPNVLGFRKTPVQADVEAAVGLPTVVDNDANVAAYAEVRFGAARGLTDAMVITLGTGIGGGVLVGGHVLRGAHGFAAEVGHFQIDPNGPMCACGERGHWEAMASGNALGAMAQAAATRGDLPSVLLAVDGDVDIDPGPARLGCRPRRRGRRARARRRLRVQRRDRSRRAREHLRPGADRDRRRAGQRRRPVPRADRDALPRSHRGRTTTGRRPRSCRRSWASAPA